MIHDDVLTAIIQPSKDISPRYRTTLIETAEGKVYQGLIIYEAVDSLILQTGPSATLRLINKILSDDLSTRQVADIVKGRASAQESTKPAGRARLFISMATAPSTPTNSSPRSQAGL